MKCALGEFLHLGVADPLDVPLAHFAFEQALGVADAIEAQMANIGFGRDEGHWDLVAHLGVAQGLVEDGGEFVGGAEAGGALDGTNDHGAGIGDEALEGPLGGHGMVDEADRLRFPLRSEAFDFVKGQFRPGGDHQIVIFDHAAVEQVNLAGGRIETLGALGMEIDVAAGEDRPEIDLDIGPVAPANRNPGVGGDEGIARALVDH